jgi:hypothetical protein
MTKPIKTPEDTATEFGLTYDPVRNYHTRRVRKLKYGPVERFWYRYNHDFTFQRFIDSLSISLATGIVTVAVITILIIVLG